MAWVPSPGATDPLLARPQAGVASRGGGAASRDAHADSDTDVDATRTLLPGAAEETAAAQKARAERLAEKLRAMDA